MDRYRFYFALYLQQVISQFDLKERVAIKKKFRSPAELNPIASEAIASKIPLKEIHLSALPVATVAYGMLPFVKTELLMLFRKGPAWFWLINLGGFIALFFMPLIRAHQVGLPVLWFLQINRWADIATKEKYNRTHYFTYAAYKPLQRLLTSQIIAGVMLATVLALPVIIRYAVAGDHLTAGSIILGALFLVTLSVFNGIISGSKRIFEIVFFMLTYANISTAPVLDYFGAFNHGITYVSIMVVIICCMLAASFMLRRYEIRNQ